MEVPAILFLESSKPLAFIGGQMGRFFISPYLPAISEEWGIKGEKLFQIFEKRKNLEILIQTLEEAAKGENKKDKNKAETKDQDKDEIKGEGEKKASWWTSIKNFLRLK
jgi:hypothetical protein